MTPHQSQFKAATLNLFNFAEPPSAFYDPENIYSQEQWAQKQAWTADLIARMQPDILGMQEVFSPDALKWVCASQGLVNFASMPTADTPDDYLKSHPVVALATRFSILDASPVATAPDLLAAYGLQPKTSFSRTPLRALIQVPGFSAVRVYVVHFKSGRPAWEQPEMTAGQFPDATTDQQQTLHRLLHPRLGSWGSFMLRGVEASMLMLDIMQQQFQRPLPTLVLGDFNDAIDSAAFMALRDPQRANIGMDEQAAALATRFRLQDASDLSIADCVPRPTHFWGAAGNRLDHILLSSEFDPSFQLSMAQVEKVEIFDRHLVRNDIQKDRQCSDHAGVCATLASRS